jgi:N-glycosylase/DNA lyase
VSSSAKVNADFLKNYFRLDDDLLNVYSKIAKDKHMLKAIQRFRGLRLVRQEPWECLISFICATYKNVPAIKQTISNICKEFGDPVEFERETYYTFPVSGVLAKANPKHLRRCKLGFRTERVLETSKLINKGKCDLESLRAKPYDVAKKELMKLPGVGHKVADCVLLFSLDKLEAFPIDVWMKRIILRYYSEHFEREFVGKVQSKSSLTPYEYQAAYDFGRRYFGDFVGYAQEYLYHNERCFGES